MPVPRAFAEAEGEGEVKREHAGLYDAEALLETEGEGPPLRLSCDDELAEELSWEDREGCTELCGEVEARGDAEMREDGEKDGDTDTDRVRGAVGGAVGVGEPEPAPPPPHPEAVR